MQGLKFVWVRLDFVPSVALIEPGLLAFSHGASGRPVEIREAARIDLVDRPALPPANLARSHPRASDLAGISAGDGAPRPR
jgi:hypothetical protein